MPRIVKADAEQLAPGRNSLEGYYRVSNTIEIKKGWRPKDYKNPVVYHFESLLM